jgi:glucarate dehydratase
LLETPRDAVGQTAVIRIDSNKAYSLAEARRIASEALDIRNFEDPVASFEAMAALRASTAIPIGVHTPDLRRAVNFGAPDAFCTDVSACAIRFAGAGAAMGVDFCLDSGDSGIASAVYLHISAALASIRKPPQSLFRIQLLDVIEEGPCRPLDSILVPKDVTVAARNWPSATGTPSTTAPSIKSMIRIGRVSFVA